MVRFLRTFGFSMPHLLLLRKRKATWKESVSVRAMLERRALVVYIPSDSSKTRTLIM